MTHVFMTRYRLVRDDTENKMTAEPCNGRYFVWDNVTLAFHVDDKVNLSEHSFLSCSWLSTGKLVIYLGTSYSFFL